MTKLLHSRSKIFFPNPYVVRVEYLSNQPEYVIEADYRRVTRRAYKLIQGTWGYSPLDTDVIQIKNDHGHTSPPGSNHFNGMSQHQIMTSLFDPDWQTVYRGYCCFKDELDALQFRLSIDTRAIQVVMWPKNIVFTIHEVMEIDASNTPGILPQT